jgi:hypothetical protein
VTQSARQSAESSRRLRTSRHRPKGIKSSELELNDIMWRLAEHRCDVIERETLVVEQGDDELLSIRQLCDRLRELVLGVPGRLVATVAAVYGRKHREYPKRWRHVSRLSSQRPEEVFKPGLIERIDAKALPTRLELGRDVIDSRAWQQDDLDLPLQRLLIAIEEALQRVCLTRRAGTGPRRALAFPALPIGGADWNQHELPLLDRARTVGGPVDARLVQVPEVDIDVYPELPEPKCELGDACLPAIVAMRPAS